QAQELARTTAGNAIGTGRTYQQYLKVYLKITNMVGVLPFPVTQSMIALAMAAETSVCPTISKSVRQEFNRALKKTVEPMNHLFPSPPLLPGQPAEEKRQSDF
ncbi:hypothetical protein JCM16303_003123, partial [Sporobolomyces ruberrimus]